MECLESVTIRPFHGAEGNDSMNIEEFSQMLSVFAFVMRRTLPFVFVRNSHLC